MKIEDKIKELIVTALTKSQGMNNDEINEVGLELSRTKITSMEISQAILH